MVASVAPDRQPEPCEGLQREMARWLRGNVSTLGQVFGFFRSHQSQPDMVRSRTAASVRWSRGTTPRRRVWGKRCRRRRSGPAYLATVGGGWISLRGPSEPASPVVSFQASARACTCPYSCFPSSGAHVSGTTVPLLQ